MRTCDKCTAGRYQPQAGQSSCIVCSRGYCTEGAVNPVSCEIGALLDFAEITVDGATTSEACVCKPKYYNSNLTGGLQCTRCQVGMACRGSATLHKLPISQGFFRVSESSIDVRRCPDAFRCSGKPADRCMSGCAGSLNASTRYASTRRALARANASTANEIANTDQSLYRRLCRSDLDGVFCQVCADDRNFYVPATEQVPAHCKLCEATLGFTIGVGMAITGAVLFTALGGFRLYHRWLPKHPALQRRLLAALEIYTPRNKLKILASFYMIAAKVSTVYEVYLPDDVTRFLDLMTVPITLGIDLGLRYSRLECLGVSGYIARLVFWMTIPAALAALVVLGATTLLRIRRLPTTPSSVFLAATPIILQLLFLLYPIISRVAFEAFSFHTFDEGTEDQKGFLRVDVQIEHGSISHNRAVTLATVAVMLYPVGLLLLSGSLLHSARESIRMGRITALSTAISFLHGEYRPDCYYWEVRPCREHLGSLPPPPPLTILPHLCHPPLYHPPL